MNVIYAYIKPIRPIIIKHHISKYSGSKEARFENERRFFVRRQNIEFYNEIKRHMFNFDIYSKM